MSREEVLSRTVFTVDDEPRTWADVLEAAEAWAAPAPAAHGTVEERATAFRRSRGLLSADDTKAWLERWGVTVEDWLAHLGGKKADPWIEAVVSGTLERTAHRLAGALAAHHALGGAGRPALAELDRALERFGAEAATPDRIDATIAANRLEWTTLELEPADGPPVTTTIEAAGP